jgi:hypothetical protein
MKTTRYSCQILKKLEFSRQISWKSVQWEPSCSMRTETDKHDALTVAFRNFAKAPKNEFNITGTEREPNPTGSMSVRCCMFLTICRITANAAGVLDRWTWVIKILPIVVRFLFNGGKKKKQGLTDDYRVCVNPPFKFLNWLADFYAILYNYYGDWGHAHLVFLHFRKLVVTTWRTYELWGKTNWSVTSHRMQNDVGLCEIRKPCSHFEDNHCRWNYNMETARNFIWLSVLRTTDGSMTLGIWNSIWKQGCRVLTCMSWCRTIPLYTSEGVLVTTWLSKAGFTHTMPFPCRSPATTVPFSDSAVSFVKVRVVDGNIRTACLLLVTTFLEFRVVAGRSRTRAGRSYAVSGRPMLIHTYQAAPMPRCAVALRGRFQNGIVVAWQGNGMPCVNQTRPHCVNQMGKTHLNP